MVSSRSASDLEYAASWIQITKDSEHQNICTRDLPPLPFLCYIEYDELNNEFYHVTNTRTKHGLIHSPSKVSFSFHFLPVRSA